jgi:hypothetical protein
MSLARAFLAVGIAGVASFAISLAIRATEGSFAQEAETTDPELGVQWDYRPEGLPDLVDASPAVVMAQVEDVHGGDLIVGQPADGQGAPFTAPTQRIDLHVTETVQGQVPENFTLFKLGEPGVQPDGDPAYQVGERYLLFVRPRLNDDRTAPNPDGTYIAVAPDGRLEKLPSGELDAQIPGPVAEELDGATVPEAEQAIDQAPDTGGSP